MHVFYSKLKQVFQLPPLGLDPLRARQAVVLNRILLASTAALLALAVVNAAAKFFPLYLASIVLVTCLGLVGLSMLLRRGNVVLVLHGALTLGVVFATAMVVVLGTSHGLSVSLFLLVILAAALLLEQRGLVAVVFICCALLLLLMLGEMRGLLSGYETADTLWLWLAYVFVFIAAGTLGSWGVRSYRRTLSTLDAELALRKQVEAERRVIQEKLSVLLNTTTDFIYLLAPDFTVLEANAAGAERMGFTRQSIVGKTMFDMTDADTAARREAHLKRAFAERKPVSFIDQRTARWFETLVFPVLDADGNAVSAAIYARDVTERIEAGRALRESEERLHQVLENAQDAVYRRNLQTDTLDFMSPAIQDMMGYSAAEWARFTAAERLAMLHPDDLERMLEAERMLHAPLMPQDAPRKPAETEYRMRHRDGTYRWLQTRLSVESDAQGNPLYEYGSARDITLNKAAEQVLRDSEALFHQMFADNSAVMLLIQPDSGALVDANLAAEKFYGYPRETLLTMRLDQVNTMPVEDIRRVMSDVAARRKNNFITRHRLASGELCDVEVHAVPIQSAQGTRLYAIIHDVTARRQAEARLEYLSTHDALTGLYNRAFFETEMKRLAASRAYPISLFVADLDNMKPVNDTLGHLAGDELLKRAADALREACRASDIVARIGGDEFAVLLPETDKAQVAHIVERVRAHVDAANQVNGASRLTLSLGAATADAGELTQAFVLADARMYSDKRKHKSRHSHDGRGPRSRGKLNE